MKPIANIDQAIYDALTANPEVVALLGNFSNSDDPEYTPVAIAAGTLPENYSIPGEKAFIVFNLESASPVGSETRTHLQNLSLKFFVGGQGASNLIEILMGQLDGTQLYNYVISYRGFNMLPDGNITIRFNLI
ncbi:hypothetical protein [Deinococcus ficus]|uniref:hypothetical protein n=1 Tax=Deinococcus ficus TaxID=317577 RepID=UPI00131AE4D5|nr:hypothetical protein [Deinococcus ficus]